MSLKLKNLFMTTMLVASQFAFGSPAHSDPQSFEEAEQRFQRVEEYFQDVKKRSEADGTFKTMGSQIFKTWEGNWRLYDKKRPSQGDEVDQLHKELHQLRDQIGVSAALLLHNKREVDLTAKERKSVKWGDGVAPNDAADLTSDVRDAKVAVLSYRLDQLWDNARNLEASLEHQQTLYAGTFAKLREVARPVNIFQPKPQEVSRVLQSTLKGAALPPDGEAVTLPGEVAIAREFVNEKSLQYLKELLENAPVQVVSLRAEFDNAPWYQAAWEPSDRAAPIHSRIDPGQLQKAYEASRIDLELEIRALEGEIASLRDVMNTLGQRWSKAANIVFDRDSTIAQAKVYLSAANASVEVVAAGSAFLASGGLSVAATPQYLALLADAADDQIVAAVKPAVGAASAQGLKTLIRSTSKHARELAVIMIEESATVANLPVSKTAQRLATGIYERYKRQILDEVRDTLQHTAFVVGPTKKFLFDASEGGYDPGSLIVGKESPTLEKMFGEEHRKDFLTVAPIVVNDVVESVVTNGGLKEFKDSYAYIKAAATGTAGKLSADTAKGAAGAGVAVLSTFLKAVNQHFYNRLETVWEKEKTRASAEAGVFKQRYSELLVARTLVEDDLIFKKRLLDSFTLLAKLGVKNQRLEVESTPLLREDFDKIARLQIIFTLSRPVLNPPVLSAPGLQLSKAVPFSGKPRVAAQTWKVEVLDANVPADAREVTLDIQLASNEVPYGSLDSDPATPLQLTSIDRLSWTGFETDAPDRHHSLPIQSDVPCDLSKTAGGGLQADAFTILGGGAPKPGTARSCDLWVQLFEDRVCEHTTMHAASYPVVGGGSGQFYDDKDVSWGMCMHYNPITRECLDGSVERQSSDICLNADGQVLRDENNRVYAKFSNAAQRPVWHNINHPSCQGQNDITVCPKTYENPRTDGQGGADLPDSSLVMLDLTFQQQQQKLLMQQHFQLDAPLDN